MLSNLQATNARESLKTIADTLEVLELAPYGGQLVVCLNKRGLEDLCRALRTIADAIPKSMLVLWPS